MPIDKVVNEAPVLDVVVTSEEETSRTSRSFLKRMVVRRWRSVKRTQAALISMQI
jgi:hypothetical protein